MGFGRWPVGGIRAWIHQPTRNFHCSQRLRTDSPTVLFGLYSSLFPRVQDSPDPLPSSVEKYGLDTDDPDFRTQAFRLKWETLLDSLSQDRPNPKRVWDAYCDIGSLVGFEKIPLRIHQQTLRKAVPPKERLDSVLAKRFQAAHKPLAPHLYESRLQTIIRNIRESGFQPALDDYHFVLAQFAAGAYPDGCRAVFRELVHRQRHQPTYKTYGLCLQAIAHRLTLPCPYRHLKTLHSFSSRMCFELLEDMSTRGVSLTSVNFDLTHRIFKATQNWRIYEYLLKVGYGVDLANPDCLALEVQNQISPPSSSFSVSGAAKIPSFPREFKPMPFSTAALNTLIDALGTRGETSRMVVAFEVLTNPLPKSTSLSSASDVSWPDDDEEESVIFYNASGSDTRTSFEYPSTTPNTTTFVFLIRHMAKAKEVVFARHYLKLASEVDRAESSRLRSELASRPLGEIVAPQLALTRAMVLPLCGLGNRMRHRPTLRWAYWMTRQAIADKEDDLRFFRDWRDGHRALALGDSDEDSVRELPDAPGHDDVNSTGMGQVVMSSAQIPSIPRIDFNTPAVEAETREEDSSGANFDLPKRPFQIDLHIALLERDIQQLKELCETTREALKRSTHRLKEKLGRRVWNNKDIFLMSKERRVHVKRWEWMSSVGFGTSGVGRGMRNADSQMSRDVPRWMEEDEAEMGGQNAIT